MLVSDVPDWLTGFPVDVLILVLVDVGLGRSLRGREVLDFGVVLILVLVDVGLGHRGEGICHFPLQRLNPCFSGCWSRTPISFHYR